MEAHIPAFQILGNHGEAKADAGEAGVLAEAAEFNGAGPGPLTLVDAVRHILLGDIGLVGRVKKDHRSHFVGIIHPLLQLGLSESGTRGIVGIAEVDHVRRLFGEFRHKIIVHGAGHVDYAGKHFLLRDPVSCPSGHNIGVHIHGIYRVADSDPIVLSKDLLDIAAVALCPVGDKDLIGGNIAAPILIIIFCDGAAQEFIPQIRRVAVECLRRSHLVHSLVQGLDNGRSQRLSHIADSQTDQLFVRMRLGISRDFFPDGGKKITSGKLQIVFINFKHDKMLLFSI